MAAIKTFVVSFVLAAAAAIIPINAQLTPNFYQRMCPRALPSIRIVVQRAIKNEPRMGASLLRLHFHDCFVNVSILKVLRLQDLTEWLSTSLF